MFRLEFPLHVLERRASASDVVLDPFSGRGTTNYAARLLGLASIGIDSNPVAVALTQAKLANASPQDVVDAAVEILSEDKTDVTIPIGEFWRLAFHRDVLYQLCKLRHALLSSCHSEAQIALRGVILGALHGPFIKTPSYFSNQCTRTYAPKPAYAVRYWKSRGLTPPQVDVEGVIRKRAVRYYSNQPSSSGVVIRGDSRMAKTYSPIISRRVNWIITSPPFYGMKTYVPDQWLRNWFVGGPSSVEYSYTEQLEHTSPEEFAAQLRTVWSHVASIAASNARLIVRFGGINDRKADPLTILKASLASSSWRIETVKDAGSADHGKRQSQHFVTDARAAQPEYDVWARLR